MKLEDQVANLKLAKELKENGYPQEGLWWWVEFAKSTDLLSTRSREEAMVYGNLRRKLPYAVAPTVAELGERLPKNTDFAKYEVGGMGGGILLFSCSYNDENVGKRVTADTEADCRAKIWLYLKKKGLLTKGGEITHDYKT